MNFLLTFLITFVHVSISVHVDEQTLSVSLFLHPEGIKVAFAKFTKPLKSFYLMKFSLFPHRERKCLNPKMPGLPAMSTYASNSTEAKRSYVRVATAVATKSKIVPQAQPSPLLDETNHVVYPTEDEPTNSVVPQAHHDDVSAERSLQPRV